MARAPGATTSSLSASGGRSSTRKSTSAPMPACPRRGTRSAAISPSTTEGVRIHHLAARRPIRHTSPRCSQSRPRHKQDGHPFSDNLDPVQRSRATSNFHPPSFIDPLLTTIVTGPMSTVSLNFYGGATFPAGNFSDGITTGTVADSGTGDNVGASLAIYVPLGYVSGDPHSSTSTWLNHTLASLGIAISGTYVWSWGTGPDQNFTLVIPGAVAV